jgi:hypothetical protein
MVALAPHLWFLVLMFSPSSGPSFGPPPRNVMDDWSHEETDADRRNKRRAPSAGLPTHLGLQRDGAGVRDRE